MSNSDKKINTKEYWKNLKEYYDDPEILKAKVDEFQDGVTDEFDPTKLNIFSRRKFLALVTASAAFGTAACNMRPRGELIPYTDRPEEVLPGKANHYASTCTGCSQGCGILVKTREGRPIKIDGNPDHPVNKGKICNIGQASILNLYDPERISEPVKNNKKATWDEIDKDLKAALSKAGSEGKEIAVITNSINSPTEKKILEDFKSKFPGTKIYSYELSSDVNRISAWQQTYGNSELPTVKWEEPDIIISLDSDFLGREGNWIENARRFSSRRDIMKNDNFNRLYVIEGALSLTGMNADYRLRLRPDFQSEFVEFLKNSLSGSSEEKVKSFSEKFSLDNKKLSQLVEDLKSHREKTLVYAGDTLPEDVHTAVNEINQMIGAEKFFDKENVFTVPALTSKEEFNRLIDSLNNKKVGVVIHYDSNPVFHLPSNYSYSEALKNVGTVVTLTELENESSSVSHYVLPINNYLESWGDHQVKTGFVSYQQPVISPLYNTRQREEIILNLTKDKSEEDAYHKYLINNFNEEVYSRQNSLTDSKNFWMSALHDGIVKLRRPRSLVGNGEKIASVNSAKGSKNSNPDSFVIQLVQSYYIGDGKFANNGWLQELPHPVSKITWDNYAAISPSTAKELKVENNDLIEVSVNDKKIELPVFVQAGMADKLIVVELGYGREVCGDVGWEVGFNVNKLVTSEYSISPWIYNGVEVIKTGGSYELAATQEHHSLDDTFVKDFHKKREIIRDVTLDEFKKDPHAIHEKEHKLFSITDEYKYTGNKWAMAIDLNKCISCGVCVSSCNVENNVPVVGKDQVIAGREMQWMRIDNYYSGEPDDPQVSNQPMLCQHCDNAPCENVCPVNATNHSPDGLNQMVYNRCVGTRYCSNNCPYKVRRFNFFNFRDHFEDGYYDKEVTKLMRNPEVTVRSRGVMEKCTFCVQRIMEARSEAIKKGRELKGNEIKTACQQACPSEAIVFGDANDPDSEVSKYREHNLGYHVLETLNVRPNVTYLARLRNIQSEEE